MKKIAVLLLTLTMICCLFGCGDTQEKPTIPEGDMAQIDDEIITAEDVQEYMTLYAHSQGSSIMDTTSEDSMGAIMMVVLDKLLEQKVLDHYLTEAGVDVMSGRESDFEEYKKEILEDEGMSKAYEEGTITDEGIEFIFKTQYLTNDFYDLVEKNTDISEEELKAYYDEHPDEMERTYVDAAHIMVTDPELADEIYDKIVNQGADFAEMAKEYSVDLNTKEDGGELGEFGKNETLPAFEEAVFAMEKGDISKPVTTDLGYHIIKLNNKYTKTLDYEICKPYIEYVLISNECSEILGERLNSTVKYLYEAEEE